jgi:NTE family protein
MRAFVLSGGASLGAIQVGMLEALYERGIAPDLIIGASVGAVNGAFIASRAPTPETARELGDIWRGLNRSAIFPLNPLTGLIGFIGRGSYLIPDGNLRRLIVQHAVIDRLENSPVPLHLIVTDVLSGEELRLSRGPAVDAVRASAAIPSVFPPVEFEGRLLMDGGISDNTPISHAVALGADEIYVLPTGIACDLEAPPQGAVAMLLHALTILSQQRLRLEIEFYRDRAHLVVMPPPCPQPILPIDFSHGAELIEQARRDGRRFLDSLDGSARDSTEPARRLAPHRHRRSRGAADRA